MHAPRITMWRRPSFRVFAVTEDTRPLITSYALNVTVVIFLIACFLPLRPVDIAGQALTPARIVMTVGFIPSVLLLISGRAGRVRLADLFIIGFVLWMSLALLVTSGTRLIAFIGITAIEFLTPYLLARTMIRTPRQYRQALRVCFIMTVLLTVSAVLEATTEIRPFNRIFDALGPTYPPVPERYERRLGMLRAQGTFQHPILFGVVMSLFVAPFYYWHRKSRRPFGIRRAIFPITGCFFALSSGAWLSTMIQLGLILWAWLLRRLRGRWALLIVLVIAAYVTVDMMSNRTPFQVFVSYMTLNQSTGYMRVLIFNHGMENVWANPFFGLGLADWERPLWMHSDSIDNFWLVLAIKFGIPAFALMALAYLSMIMQLARAKPRDRAVAKERNGLVFALIAVALSACTVHLWGTALYVVIFLLGAGGWISDYDPPQDRPEP